MKKHRIYDTVLESGGLYIFLELRIIPLGFFKHSSL